MRKRTRASRGSRRSFNRGANRTHPRNIAPPPMRGGYRM